ncbi:hypothetical protein Fmac_008319 [Flemingia macrophylla]|uniref:BTB domain-containing protein n=1 Tax=Flemingia macrophylla TaxID=520843 RepID=A0ABD1MX42_9FABA
MTIVEELDLSDLLGSSVPVKKVPNGDVFEASRAGDVERLRYLLEAGVNVNARDQWDSVALYYACLAGHLDAARMLLENGAICSEHTFDGDRCHYAALNLNVRKLLKAFEARPPPLHPLQASLRDTFLAAICGGLGGMLGLYGSARRIFLLKKLITGFKHLQHHVYDKNLGRIGISSTQGSICSHFPPDVVFIVQGRPIQAHRVILSARSSFFKKKFTTVWKERSEVRFSRERLSYPALYSLIHFFYSDRLEIAIDDMEDLVRICKVCKCESLQKVLEKEVIHQTYADYKALRDVDNSQKRYILQGLSLPEEDRLPAALHRILVSSNSESGQEDEINKLVSRMSAVHMAKSLDDLADVCVKVDRNFFRCHQVILASRSEYFKARLSHMKDFHEGKEELSLDILPCLEEHDFSMEAFEKMIMYIYTDRLQDINPDQAEEMLDVASRYLMFSLKRAVADVLLPHLEMLSPEELCHWYGVFKIREYCLDTIACNFETFADTKEFRAMLLTLPPPSGDSCLRTTVPSIPGSALNTNQGNLLDDLREKWLEIEAAELDKRDESALQFDRRLEMLMLIAEQENSSDNADSEGIDDTLGFLPNHHSDLR